MGEALEGTVSRLSEYNNMATENIAPQTQRPIRPSAAGGAPSSGDAPISPSQTESSSENDAEAQARIYTQAEVDSLLNKKETEYKGQIEELKNSLEEIKQQLKILSEAVNQNRSEPAVASAEPIIQESQEQGAQVQSEDGSAASEVTVAQADPSTTKVEPDSQYLKFAHRKFNQHLDSRKRDFESAGSAAADAPVIEMTENGDVTADSSAGETEGDRTVTTGDDTVTSAEPTATVVASNAPVVPPVVPPPLVRSSFGIVNAARSAGMPTGTAIPSQYRLENAKPEQQNIMQRLGGLFRGNKPVASTAEVATPVVATTSETSASAAPTEVIASPEASESEPTTTTPAQEFALWVGLKGIGNKFRNAMPRGMSSQTPEPTPAPASAEPLTLESLKGEMLKMQKRHGRQMLATVVGTAAAVYAFENPELVQQAVTQLVEANNYIHSMETMLGARAVEIIQAAPGVAAEVAANVGQWIGNNIVTPMGQVELANAQANRAGAEAVSEAVGTWAAQLPAELQKAYLSMSAFMEKNPWIGENAGDMAKIIASLGIWETGKKVWSNRRNRPAPAVAPVAPIEAAPIAIPTEAAPAAPVDTTAAAPVGGTTI